MDLDDRLGVSALARLFGLSHYSMYERIESAAERIGAVDVVTARALAPMEKQLSLAYPLLSTGACGIFLKGQDVDSELTEAAKSWSIDASIQPSLTDPRGRIVLVNRAQPLGKR